MERSDWGAMSPDALLDVAGLVLRNATLTVCVRRGRMCACMVCCIARMRACVGIQVGVAGRGPVGRRASADYTAFEDPKGLTRPAGGSNPPDRQPRPGPVPRPVGAPRRRGGPLGARLGARRAGGGAARGGVAGCVCRRNVRPRAGGGPQARLLAGRRGAGGLLEWPIWNGTRFLHRARPLARMGATLAFALRGLAPLAGFASQGWRAKAGPLGGARHRAGRLEETNEEAARRARPPRRTSPPPAPRRGVWQGLRHRRRLHPQLWGGGGARAGVRAALEGVGLGGEDWVWGLKGLRGSKGCGVCWVMGGLCARGWSDSPSRGRRADRPTRNRRATRPTATAAGRVPPERGAAAAGADAEGEGRRRRLAGAPRSAWPEAGRGGRTGLLWREVHAFEWPATTASVC